MFNLSRRILLPAIQPGQIVRHSVKMIVAIEDDETRETVKPMLRDLNSNIVKLCMKTSPVLLVLGVLFITRTAITLCWQHRHEFAAARQRKQQIGPSIIPVPPKQRMLVRKVTTQHMHRTHEAVWIESREYAHSEALVACR